MEPSDGAPHFWEGIFGRVGTFCGVCGLKSTTWFFEGFGGLRAQLVFQWHAIRVHSEFRQVNGKRHAKKKGEHSLKRDDPWRKNPNLSGQNRT